MEIPFAVGNAIGRCRLGAGAGWWSACAPIDRESRRRLALAALAIASVAICFQNLAGYRTLTAHETLVAQTAREMAESGDLILPTYFGEARLKKPPLAYWEARLAFAALGGRSEFAARLPSALAGLATVALIAFVARARYGRRVGALAGFAQLTMVGFLTQSRLAEVDMTLSLLVGVALVAYGWTALGRRWSAARWWIGWGAAGVAVLAKGPVGPLIIGAVIAAHSVVTRRWPAMWSATAAKGAALFLAIALAWPMTVAWQRPDAWRTWTQESVGRWRMDPNGVHRHAFYYPAAAMWLTAPWTPTWVGWLAVRARRRRRWRSDEAFLLAWLVAPMAVLSMSSGKQEHYLLPALAPCAIWAALGLRAIARRRPTFGTHGWRWAAVGVVAILATVQFVLPAIHGRREQADWVRDRLRAGRAEPVVALGHRAQAFVFYASTPMRRIDSLEAFFERGERAWVLTTRVNLPALASRGRMSSLEVGPEDEESPDKTLLLGRFEPGRR